MADYRFSAANQGNGLGSQPGSGRFVSWNETLSSEPGNAYTDCGLMNGEGLDRVTEAAVNPLRLLSTFWGLAVICLLGAYAVIQVVEEAPSPPTVRTTIAKEAAGPGSFPSFVPPPSYPEVERDTVTLNLACGADDVRGGGASAGRYPITMRFDQVPDDIRALLDGTDTVFPKDARITMSPCIRAMIDRGELP